MSIFDAAVTNFIDRKLSQPAKPRSVTAQRNLAKGIIAGIAAGLVATAAKTLVERVYPPRVPGEPEPPAGHQLATVSKAVASESTHWVFGAAAGAAYGALAEYYPAATSRDGISFGMTLMALTHESSLPAMGIAQAPATQSTRERTSEMASHIIYGLAAETTRRFVRKML